VTPGWIVARIVAQLLWWGVPVATYLVGRKLIKHIEAARALVADLECREDRLLDLSTLAAADSAEAGYHKDRAEAAASRAAEWAEKSEASARSAMGERNAAKEATPQ